MANVSYAFDEIRNRIIKRLQSKASWAEILPYSTNMRLIDAIAEEIQELSAYDEYLTRETKWRLAQNRSSLVNQADILGYGPHRKISSVGFIRFSTSAEAIDPSVRVWSPTIGYTVGSRVAYFDGNRSRIYEATYGIEPTSEEDPNDPPSQSGDWTRVNLSYPHSILIPRFTTFSDGGEMIVTNVDAYTLTSENDYVDVGVVQGIPKQETREAVGANYEEFTIDNDSIAETHTELEVNGIEWFEVPDLRLSDEDSTDYSIRNLPDASGIVIRFGNNVFGKALEPGESVLFRFIETLGIEGNITSFNVIDEVEDRIYDSLDNEVEVFCTNDTIIGGGEDNESVESIRTNAPRIFQTGGRATSSSDYQAILESFEFVSRAIAWGAYEYNIDNNLPPGTFISSAENVVRIGAFTTAGTELSESQKDEARVLLNEVKSPTDIIAFEPVNFVGLVFNVDARVRDRDFTLSQVRTNIELALSEEYDVNRMNFAQNLYESDYVSFIDDIEGVHYHNTIVQMFQEIEFESGYATSWRFASFPILPGSVEVYLKKKEEIDPDDEYELIATDTGTGGVSGVSGWSTFGSTVNYEYGTGAILNVEPPSGDPELGPFFDYSIKIQFRTVDPNLILSRRSQVFSFHEAIVTTQYTG